MVKHMFVASLLVTLAVAGCAARLSDVPLGKVVVYRNGVAYFERLATVNDGTLTLLIAKSRVDDLLKSLTVRDAVTGKSLPISFPARQASSDLVRMTVRVPGKRSRKVKLSYVSESPAWKPSYRLMLNTDGTLTLQGWAIVDNVSGEDWKNVVVGVGTTSALSFRYDLWSVRDVRRQTLGQRERVATAPPTATGLRAVASRGPAKPKASITLGKDYTKNLPIPGRTFESSLGAAAGTSQSDTQGVSFSGSTTLENQYVIDGVNTTLAIDPATATTTRRSKKERAAERERRALYLRTRRSVQAEQAKVKRRNAQLARRLASTTGDFVIEGIASPSQRNSRAVALRIAHHLRNDLIRRGIAPERLAVQTRVGAIGEPTTLKVTARTQTRATAASRHVVGESKFLSATAISIPDQGSSMVSIVDHKTKGKVVYLYDPLSLRGNKQFAFKAIRFRNPTQKYLEGGPITVFGDGSFVGEGLTETIAPGATAILPYALDKQVYVQRHTSFTDTVVAFKGVLDDGAVVAKERLRTVRFSVHNRSHKPVVVYIRHDTNLGWKLKKGPANLERLGRMNVFAVELQPGGRKTVQTVEYTPITATLDLTTDRGVAALSGYLRTNTHNTKFVQAATRLVTAHRSIARKLKRIDHVAGTLVLYRDRVAQLHVQAVTLAAVKSRGNVMRRLHKSMKDFSSRVQRAIVQIVALRERIMVERFAYRELVTAMVGLTRPS